MRSRSIIEGQTLPGRSLTIVQRQRRRLNKENTMLQEMGRAEDYLDLGEDARTFQSEVREWLAENAPKDLIGVQPGLRTPGPQRERLREWGDHLHAAGYMCVAWPKEHGGRGLTPIELALLNEEFHRSGVPRVTRGMGEWLVGPSIIMHGTEEQKETFLPRIIAGEDRYCQGFSEPDAGSDLASLRTKGAIQGDEVIVTGQKVWTSGHFDATMMFCLCRTDESARKHAGISYVLIPIELDGKPNGIEFRGIKQMSGHSHFAETFIDGARAPLDNVIGGLNNGWRVAMTTLGNERGGNATTQYTGFADELEQLVDEARARGKLSDPQVRNDLAWAYCNVEVMRYGGLRLLGEMVAGADSGGSGSTNKIRWSEYGRRLGEIALDLIGPESLVVGDDYSLGAWQETFLTNRTTTIWGGTAEIQRNIISERVLGLPKEARA
jgi:alkylation response protein AidB-like acyl-CoA dehydrogenase